MVAARALPAVYLARHLRCRKPHTAWNFAAALRDLLSRRIGADT